MEAISIREKLHQYVDDSDEKLLKLMFALAKEYNEDDELDYEFTAEEIKEFDELRRRRLSGESKTYSWNEAKNLITQKSS